MIILDILFIDEFYLLLLNVFLNVVIITLLLCNALLIRSYVRSQIQKLICSRFKYFLVTTSSHSRFYWFFQCHLFKIFLLILPIIHDMAWNLSSLSICLLRHNLAIIVLVRFTHNSELAIVIIPNIYFSLDSVVLRTVHFL